MIRKIGTALKELLTSEDKVVKNTLYMALGLMTIILAFMLIANPVAFLMMLATAAGAYAVGRIIGFLIKVLF